MTDAKSLLASKTIWGALIALLAGALSLLGYQLAPADQAELVNLASGLGAAVGGAVAI